MTDRDDYGLGRIHVPDMRDGNYPLAAALPAGRPPRRWRYWRAGWRGDQGNTSQCVAYSWLHWLEAMGRPGDPDEWDPEAVYRRAQQVDQWEGDSYDGTSVRAGAKVLQSAGLIGVYRWATSVSDIITAILTSGPVVAGTVWREAMFEPNPDGVIFPTGPVAGGHAYLLDGVNADQTQFSISNSWGPSFGKNGRCWIGVDDFAGLLADDGEACLPTKT